MNVKNRKCIRKLSLKSLYANRRRNLIAIFAIALTTMLFTSMFTIVLSLNASYETYQFRQVGGYAHGTFKDVSPEQAERIAAHPKVKAAGIRKVIGITAEGVFAKVPAEISYMDANCTKWSYATPTTGRMPESGKEVAMDTAALQLLGVRPELGAEVTVSYSITDKDQTAFTVTDTFTLVGYWDYDELMPVHYINISRDYADDIEAQAVKTGLQPFRTDLNVMLASGTNIQGQMEQVDTDLGYTWDSYTDPNSVRIGVNWGYTSSQLESHLDPELVIAIAAFLLLVIFTGYLIIYNIFQISVAGDIRFYGLLKTIGTTPRQLKRIIRQQALLLCLIGIPVSSQIGKGHLMELCSPDAAPFFLGLHHIRIFGSLHRRNLGCHFSGLGAGQKHRQQGKQHGPKEDHRRSADGGDACIQLDGVQDNRHQNSADAVAQQQPRKRRCWWWCLWHCR